MPPDTESQPSHPLGPFDPQLAQELLKLLLPGQSGGNREILEALGAGLSHDTRQWTELHAHYAQRQLDLWMRLLSGRLADEDEQPPPDRRFRAPEWKENPFFDYLRRSYLLNSEWMLKSAESSRLEPQAKKKLLFFTRQYLDALCPANFPATNPESLKLAADTEGESTARGLRNFLADWEKGRISMTDESAFQVGRNLAITPGSVVYQTPLFQLIQYAPTTDKVYRHPLLMVPPFINKYYILDLQPDNSFVRHLVSQGHTVFLISWRNIPPGSELGRATWEDYMEQVVFKAMDAALAITGAPRLNTLGFCVGGTLLACALAVLRARGDKRVRSLTLLTTMLDFADPGEICVYVDQAYVQKKEADYAAGGVMHGRELATAFASLRANELIWFYVVNSYLKGKAPDAFDLLYWNSDSANLPGTLYAWYVRNAYLENSLRIPGKLTLSGTPVDLGKIDLPTYVLAAKEDHIVPWQSALASARLLSGKIDFVLAASGHIAGVVNPASRNRRNFWVDGSLAQDAGAWLESARSFPGSWWNHWTAWLKGKGGARVPAPKAAGSDQYPPLEPAPGSYVQARFD